MRRFEYIDSKSSKFWEIEQDGTHLTVHWGKMGTHGQSQTKPFDNASKASAAMLKMIKEKTNKGYEEVQVSEKAKIDPQPIKINNKSTEANDIADCKKSAVQTEPQENDPSKLVQTNVVDVRNAKQNLESFDQQSDRVLKSLIQQIINGVFDEQGHISLSRICKAYSLNEAAAYFILLRCHLLYLGSLSGNCLYLNIKSVHHAAQQCLKTILAEKESNDTRSTNNLVEDNTLPPWLRQGTPLWIIPELTYLACSSRRFPRKILIDDAETLWQRVKKIWALEFPKSIPQKPFLMQTELKQLNLFVTEEEQFIKDHDSNTLLLAIALSYVDSKLSLYVMQLMLITGGERYTMEQYIEALQCTIEYGYDPKSGRTVIINIYKNGNGKIKLVPWPLSYAEYFLRQWLTTLPEPLYLQCLAIATENLNKLKPEIQVRMGALFADEGELSNQLIFRLTAHPPVPAAVYCLQLTATDTNAIALARKVNKEDLRLFDSYNKIGTLLQEKGIEALPFLALEAETELAGMGLIAIGLPEAIQALAKATGLSKTALIRLRIAAQRWPAAAMAGLGRIVSTNNKEVALFESLLRELVADYPELIEQISPWVEPAVKRTLQQLQQQIYMPTTFATASELPNVLVNPPWLLKSNKKSRKIMTIPTIMLAAIEYWDEHEREQKQRVSSWIKKDVELAREKPERLLNELNICEVKNNPQALALKNKAIAALEAGDGIKLAELWTEYAQKYPRYPYNAFFIRCDYMTAIASPQTAIDFINSAIAAMNKISRISLYGETILFAHYGLALLPSLVLLVNSQPTQGLPIMMNFGAVELAPFAARAFAKLKKFNALGRQWLLRFPEHAICGLIAPALGKVSEAKDCAIASLRFLVEEGFEKLIMEVAHRYQQDKVVEELKIILNEDPLDLFPSKRSALPNFWQPQLWRRPQLHNGHTLSDSALAHLGTMLTFPTQNGLYEGLKQVKALCTSESLGHFLWDLFGAWLNAGAASKDNWVLTILGYLGNDDIARKLTPFIRAWPGEAAHSRAVTGLDVLANIGTDVALMMLNGIAQKIKFKGLQDKAKEKIADIAEARNLTLEELDDRLAPDLGLDSNGSLVLNLGPRQFNVSFDESLKPFVREIVEGKLGSRLADLPKPKKSDDSDLSKAAVERFKLLKKDARMIASQQLMRLETAMCTRRRWNIDIFMQFMVYHPLIRHLVQRLVWGVYHCASDQSYGGELVECFRVSEDGSFTTADDDVFDLPKGENIKIGLPHTLEISMTTASAFGQLFTDYELLQPFMQLGRDIYSLTEAEKKQQKLNRWENKVVPTGRVLGLVNKGWRRGDTEDGGGIWYFTKAIRADRYIKLELDPGIIVGMVDEYPEQTLGSLIITKHLGWVDEETYFFSTLDPIIASELIRDMEALCEGVV